MRVFFDTNILLDVIENREGLVEASQDVLDRCDEQQAETFIAWYSLVTASFGYARQTGCRLEQRGVADEKPAV